MGSMRERGLVQKYRAALVGRQVVCGPALSTRPEILMFENNLVPVAAAGAC